VPDLGNLGFKRFDPGEELSRAVRSVVKTLAAIIPAETLPFAPFDELATALLARVLRF
jgi:hypothetical protein